MRSGFITFLLSLFSVTCSFAAQTDIGKIHGTEALDTRQQSIVTISAFTANGNIERLKPALNAGLEADLSVNEIKEILIQLYAYCGFPRSLNGINAFMEVMKEREAKGIQDIVGKEATPLPKELDKDAYGSEVRRKLAGWDEEPPVQGLQLFTPVIITYAKEHLFADIFARDVLSYQERELVTISALAVMPGTEGQLEFHLGAAMNVGLSAEQLKSFITVLHTKVDKDRAKIVNQILTDVLKHRKELPTESDS